jgi:hypothetical protein
MRSARESHVCTVATVPVSVEVFVTVVPGTAACSWAVISATRVVAVFGE